jgi:ribosomal protein L16 Arg81 hydroxylase
MAYVQPHTDPYDVLVVQVSGEKDWTVCTPFPKTGGARAEGLNPAQRAQLQEVERESIHGCTAYVEQDLKALECETITLTTGSTLYMPKGTVHMARTQAEAASTHITIGLFRKGHTWLDLFSRRCHLVTDSRNCEQLAHAVVAASHTPEGLVWLDLASPPLTLATADERLQALKERFRALVTGEKPDALAVLYKQQGPLSAGAPVRTLDLRLGGLNGRALLTRACFRRAMVSPDVKLSNSWLKLQNQP